MGTNPFAVFPLYSDLQLDLVILSNSKYLLSGCFAWNLLPEYSHANGTAAWSKKQLLHSRSHIINCDRAFESKTMRSLD
ncbi:hypothetical protein [Nostoc sp.]|uniref:hypothetical protein n=1 Tax=Nostoc sp. TaxID=1180 RepID=UPI002FF1CE62